MNLEWLMGTGLRSELEGQRATRARVFDWFIGYRTTRARVFDWFTGYRTTRARVFDWYTG